MNEGIIKSEMVTDSNGVVSALNIKESEGIFYSSGVLRGEGISFGRGVTWSRGVATSKFIWGGEGVANSTGVYGSYGVYFSDGVIRSEGVAWSIGVIHSKGVVESFGVIESYGVCYGIFVSHKSGKYIIFNQYVSEERFEEVERALKRKIKKWRPQFNNIYELYLQAEKDWGKAPIDETQEMSKEGAWRGIPQEAVEYIKSLAEFDADIFREITGIV